MVNKHVYVEGPKYNVNRQLASFSGLTNTESTLQKLQIAREQFLDGLNGFSSMLDIRNIKTSIQWQAFMKVCEKLLSFDNMINQCLTNDNYEQLKQTLDRRAEDLIKELGEM